ncbi:MAG: S-layer protein [Candidatus Peregrinibacteria bacterium GW2011_GWF2_39_17]|nr:MAG: S-layer protein [Candidatus Peregrinibacteria bacterium GW2011_GWF2_39_17]HCW32715.1 hypothetical protein [Candidatus Peregrinibacteria bacterium]
MFTSKKIRNISLGIFGVLIIGTLVIGANNLINFQGKTKINVKPINFTNQQTTTQASKSELTTSDLVGAIKIESNLVIAPLDANYNGNGQVKVYNFKITNTLKQDLAVYKLSAEFSQEGFEASPLKEKNSWSLSNADHGNTLSLSQESIYQQVPFILNTPLILKAGEIQNLAISAPLNYDSKAQKSTGQAMFNVWLPEETIGSTKVAPGPKSGTSYDEVDKAGAYHIFSTSSTVYFNSAYPDNTTQSVDKLPSKINRLTCDETTSASCVDTSKDESTAISNEQPNSGSDKNISRGEFINIIYSDLKLVYLGNEQSCIDVLPSYQYYNAIQYAREHGWIQGYADETCKPEALIIRSDAAKIMDIAYGIQLPDSYKGYFQDVPADVWFTSYAEGLYEAGAAKDYGTYFYPSNYLQENDLYYWINNKK